MTARVLRRDVLRGGGVLLGSLVLAAGCQAAPHDDWDTDEAAIRARIAEYLEAWNAGDAERIALCYAEDGDRINGRGRRFADRASIREHYRRLFATTPAGVSRRLVYEPARIRPVAPGVALADAEYAVVGVGPDPTRPVAGICTSVLVEVDGAWLRAAHRNIVPDNSFGSDASFRPPGRLDRPRVPPVEREAWTPEQRAYLEPYEEAGRLQHVFETAAHHPDFARSFDGFVLGHVNGDTSTLSPRQRELLVLRIAWLCRAEYAWAQHARIARSIGFTEEELRRITTGPRSPGWTPLEAALLSATDELHRDAFVGDATWQALAARLDTRQLIDVVATVGAYRLACTLLESLGVPLDEGLQGFPR